MRIAILAVAIWSGPALAERDAELDALLGEAEATTEDKAEKKEALEPLFVIPFQPIWNSVEPDVVEEAFKHIADVLREDAGYKVRLFRQRGRLAKGADPSARVAKKYYKEMAYAETLLKLNKPGQALRAAKPVLRKIWQNARHIRGSDTYCRCLAVAGEAHIRMGKTKAARKHVDELVTRCDGAFLNTTTLKYSQRFNDMVKGRSAALEDDRSGRLTIHADLPKARILLNGRPLGEAPLTITDLPKGRHLIGVVKKDHRAWGATPVLAAGQALELRATVTRGLEDKGLRTMFGTLRDNRIDRAVMRQATQMLRKKGGGAKLGVLGVLGRQGNKIRMTLIGFNREGRSLRLKQADFGQDFLTVNLAMMGVTEKLKELESSGGRSLVAGEPLISGLRKGSWTPKERRWVSMRDDQRAVSQQAAAQAANAPRGPLARRKKAASEKPPAQGVPDRIERTGKSTVTAKPEDPARAAKRAAERKAAAERREAAKAAAAKRREVAKAAAAKKAAETTEAERLAQLKAAVEAKEAAQKKAVLAEARKLERAERWAAWRARLGNFLSSPEWRQQQVTETLFGLRIAQDSRGGAGRGDVELSIGRRHPSILSETHWRYGLQLGLSSRSFDFSSDALWNQLAFPFLDQTAESEDLAEAFRYEGSLAGILGAGLGIDRAVGALPLRVRLDLGMGMVARESTIIHEQFILEAGVRARNSGIDLRASDPFLWTGYYTRAGVGLEYVDGIHSGSMTLEWTDTTLQTVESFGTIEFNGETDAQVLVGIGYTTSF